MGGTNPYIRVPTPPKPKRKYTIHFKGIDRSIEVDPSQVPYGETGQPGSILDVALTHGVDIDHACGGVCACSTCHVYVEEGGDACSLAHEAELDMLENAPDLKPKSRLACQCVPTGDKDVTVVIPSWNRNLAREQH